MKTRYLNLILFLIFSFYFIECCFTKHAHADSNEFRKTVRSMPNVILITISTLRADHVRCLGYARNTTPNFDKFCKGGILFRNAFAASSWTLPAHGSIFTSLYPSTHGAENLNNSLKQKYDTLAEILKKNGYYCAGFSSNPRLSKKYGFAQGFDFYDDYSAVTILTSMVFENEKSVDVNKLRTNNLVNNAAIRWLQNNTHEPLFMFIHYYDNHWDYLPPAPYNGLYDPNYKGPINGTGISKEPLFSNPPSGRDIQHIISLYDGEVRQTDDDLGEMLNFLTEKNFLANNIIIILGDHGEEFYEHGHTSHHGLYDELTHIPLVMAIPGSKIQSKIIDSLVTQVDILPTVLDYLKIPMSTVCHGKSLKPLIEDSAKSINSVIFSEYTGGAIPDCYSVRSLRYKYYETEGNSFGFDLQNDPNEQKTIYPENFPNEIIQLGKKLKQYKQLSSEK